MKPVTTPVFKKTQDEVRQDLIRQGVSVAELCRRHGVPYHTAKDLMRGRNKGLYGKSHKAAVMLGMK